MNITKSPVSDKKPLVSVWLVTYNHLVYIEKCLNGILMQKTNFLFDIVIGEDCSTDGTREIVLKYKKKYPDKIHLIISQENVGMKANAKRSRAACSGTYIASCEGDDYWIDPLKLQKQVDFMEINPNLSMCFHNAIILGADNYPFSPQLYCPRGLNSEIDTDYVIKNWTGLIPSASRMFKKKIVMNLPAFVHDYEAGDHATALFCSLKGNIGYIDEVMSIYNKHDGGWTMAKNRNWNERFISANTFFHNFNNFTSYAHVKSSRYLLKKIPSSQINYLFIQFLKLPYRLFHINETIYKFKLNFNRRFNRKDS